MSIKEQYIKELKYELSQTTHKAEITDIISDYNNFFDEGMLEGKSEQELINEFGSPQDIAQKLKDNTDSQYITYKFNIKNKNTLINIAKVLLISFLIVMNLYYSASFYRFNNTLTVSLVVCILNILLLYLIHKCFKTSSSNYRSIRINKAMTITSYLLPIVSVLAMVIMIIYTTYLVAIKSENSGSIFSFWINIVINYVYFSVVATSVLMIFVAIRKKNFSFMHTGFQFVLFTFVFLLNNVLANTDVDSSDGLWSLYKYTFESSISFSIIVLIFIAAYFCYKLVFHAKSFQEFLPSILILIVHAIFILTLNLSMYNFDIFTLVVLETLLISLIVSISIFTKRNQNYCFSPTNSTNISLVGLIAIPLLCIIIMVFLKDLYFNLPSKISLAYEYVTYTSLSVLSTLLCTAYLIFIIIYNVNGKSKKSHRYISLIGITPILSVRYFILFRELGLEKPTSWNEQYVSGMKDLKTFAIISVIISIVIPLIMLTADKFISLKQNKRGEHRCKLN